MEGAILGEIQELIRYPVNSGLISFVASQAASVIPCYQNNYNMKQQKLLSSDGRYGILPPLHSFIEFLVKRSNVRAGTLLAALVFSQRLQKKLSLIAKGMPCTAHRIFLATLIVTSKSIHDTSPKNKHWARYAAYFSLSEINLMEKQLLSLINYQILISPNELIHVYYQFKSFTNPPYPIKAIPDDSLQRPTPAALLFQQIADADIPTYAANIYSSSMLNGSNLSLSSSTDSIATPDNATSNFYYDLDNNSQYPPQAHCRIRKVSELDILRHNEDI